MMKQQYLPNQTNFLYAVFYGSGYKTQSADNWNCNQKKTKQQ